MHPLGAPAPLPAPPPVPRWWLFPAVTLEVVAVVSLVWFAPGLTWLLVLAGLVLVGALAGVGVCLVRGPRTRDTVPVAVGLVWSLPLGATSLLAAFFSR